MKPSYIQNSIYYKNHIHPPDVSSHSPACFLCPAFAVRVVPEGTAKRNAAPWVGPVKAGPRSAYGRC